MLRNTENNYGIVAKTLHWLVAMVVVAMFALGLWMVELTYYDELYKTAPWIHKSIGVSLFAVMLLRFAWRVTNPKPSPEPGSALEHRIAAIVHALLYVLLFAIMIAGYLISTADGRAVEVFGLFSVPATITGIEEQEDIAGEIHFILAVALMVLASVHALAALKHHFINHDRTLKRMLGVRHQ